MEKNNVIQLSAKQIELIESEKNCSNLISFDSCREDYIYGQFNATFGCILYSRRLVWYVKLLNFFSVDLTVQTCLWLWSLEWSEDLCQINDLEFHFDKSFLNLIFNTLLNSPMTWLCSSVNYILKIKISGWSISSAILQILNFHLKKLKRDITHQDKILLILIFFSLKIHLIVKWLQLNL